jgi:ABC-2 type transport system permease protein
MIPTLKGEFRKLFTVRSTYLLPLIPLAIISIFGFYIEGYRGSGDGPAGALPTNTALSALLLNIVNASTLFTAIIAVLFIAHEYRYNTIMHTLTISNSRTKVLLSKIIVTVIFSIFLTAFFCAYGVLVYCFGLSLRNASLPAQTIDWVNILSRVAFYAVAYSLIGLMITALMRNLVAGIVTLLIAPITVEPLLALLLKHNAVYLPFAALGQVAATDQAPSIGGGTALSPGKAALTVSVYLVVGWIVTWYFFLKRDAN